jgi:hypothetical protein
VKPDPEMHIGEPHALHSRMDAMRAMLGKA